MYCGTVEVNNRLNSMLLTYGTVTPLDLRLTQPGNDALGLLSQRTFSAKDEIKKRGVPSLAGNDEVDGSS